MQMKAIAAHYGIEGGFGLGYQCSVDMLIFGAQLDDAPKVKDLIDNVEQKSNAGEISVDRIEEAYRRVKQLKHHCLRHITQHI